MKPTNNNYNPKHTKNAIIALIILFLVIIITITILTPLLHKNIINPVASPILNSNNLSQIESVIKNHLQNVYDLSYDKISNLSITIREDTFQYKTTEDGSLSTTSFLIDVNQPQLTFQVNYEPAINIISLNCPSIELAQNPNVFCIAHEGQSTIDANLSQHLPYHGTTADNIDFSISHSYDDSKNNPRLDIYASVCGDETAATEVETAVKKWIESKGISNPDIIPLHFPHSYCNDRD